MNIRRKFLAACVTGAVLAGSSITAEAQTGTITKTNNLALYDGPFRLLVMPPDLSGDQILQFPDMTGGGSFIMSTSDDGQTLTNGLDFEGTPLTGTNALVNISPTLTAAGTYYGLRSEVGSGTSGLINIIAVRGIAGGTDDAAIGGEFAADGSGTNIGATFAASGGSVSNVGATFAAGGAGSLGIQVLSGGISNTGGLNNNSGGITNAGSITGGTALTSSGTITFSGLTASLPVKTNASSQLVAAAINLGSAEVTGTLPAASVGNGLTNTQVNNDLTIDGGTVNNTVIGGTGAAAGTFTTLTATSLDLTTPLATSEGGTGIGTAPTAAGEFLRSSGVGTWAISTIQNGDIQDTDLPSNVVLDGDIGNGLTVSGGTVMLGGTLTDDATITTDDTGGDLLVTGDGAFNVSSANTSITGAVDINTTTGSSTINIGALATGYTGTINILTDGGSMTIGNFANTVNFAVNAGILNIGGSSGTINFGSTSGVTIDTRGTMRFDNDGDNTAGEYTIFAFDNTGGGDQTITFPDGTGTVALTSALSNYVELVSGTTNRISVDNTDPQNPIVDIDANYIGQSSITTVGTITTGTWNGTDVAVSAGGTGLGTITQDAVIYGNGTSAVGIVTNNPDAGTTKVLSQANVAGDPQPPVWSDPAALLSGNFIVNDDSPAQSANFNITGTGAIGTSLTTPAVYGGTAANSTLILAGSGTLPSGDEVQIMADGSATLTVNGTSTDVGNNLVIFGTTDFNDEIVSNIIFDNVNHLIGIADNNASAGGNLTIEGGDGDGTLDGGDIRLIAGDAGPGENSNIIFQTHDGVGLSTAMTIGGSTSSVDVSNDLIVGNDLNVTSTITVGTTTGTAVGTIVIDDGNSGVATIEADQLTNAQTFDLPATGGTLVTTSGATFTGLVTAQNGLTVTGGTLNADGATTLNGNVTLGNGTADVITVNTTDDFIVTADNITIDGTGNLAADGTLTAGTGITASTGNINAQGGQLRTGGIARIDNSGNAALQSTTTTTLSASGTFTANAAVTLGDGGADNVTVNTTGSLLVTADNITIDGTGNLAADGSLTAGSTVTAGTGITATTGNLTFGSAAADVVIANTATLDITDGTNTLMSLADNGATGTLTVNTLSVTNLSMAGDLDMGGSDIVDVSDITFSGATNNITTAAAGNLIIAPGAGGDLIITADNFAIDGAGNFAADGSVTVGTSLRGAGSGSSGAESNRYAERYTLTGGAATEVINNSLVTTSSVIVATLADDDGITIHAVTPGSGSFTVTFSAVVTAGVRLSYIVINP